MHSFSENDNWPKGRLKIGLNALSSPLDEMFRGNQSWLYFCPGKQLCDAENCPMIFVREKCEKIRHCDWSPDLWRIFSEKCKQGTAGKFR